MSNHSEVSIDYASCFGHGRCYSTAPDVFEADDDGRGHVRDGADLAGSEAAISQAVLLCPESAIAWRPPAE
jgi:ferredoxin